MTNDVIRSKDDFYEAIADYIENMWDWGIPFEELNGEDDIIAELQHRIDWVNRHFQKVETYRADREEKLKKFSVVEGGKPRRA